MVKTQGATIKIGNIMKNSSLMSILSVNVGVCTSLLCTSLLMMSSANAGVGAINDLSVGINAVYDEQGFSDYDSDVAILPSVFYEGTKFYARGNRFGYKLLDNSDHELSIVTQYNGVNYDPDKANNQFRKLDERKASFFVGASYMKFTPIGALRGQVFTDAFGDSDGTLARLAYVGRYQGSGMALYPSVGVQWQDKNYNEHYYGISDKESTHSGIESYRPDDSLHPYANLMGKYQIASDWEIFFNQHLAYNSDEQHDSPKVDKRIKFNSALGVIYTF